MEASVEKDGTVRVHRVVCAVDCGRAINPDIIKAQMEGGIIFGLTAALKTEITLENGRVQQHNFYDSPMLRMFESPEIEVHIVASEAPAHRRRRAQGATARQRHFRGDWQAHSAFADWLERSGCSKRGKIMSATNRDARSVI